MAALQSYLSKFFLLFITLWLFQAEVGAQALAHKKLTAPAQWLDQGWTPAQREAFYTTPQGSYLIPKDWFLSLEQKGKQQFFAAPSQITRYGYLLQNRDLDKSVAIPLGFAVESRVGYQDWIGYTCAACHTNDITYGEYQLRIDGAPALADFESFYWGLSQAVEATLQDENKFLRFADRVLHGDDWHARADLREELVAWSNKAQAFFVRNSKPHAYGYGRLDAFGIIMNELFARDLGVADNRGSPNAPVNYPFLWGTPTHDFVQWNGSANNPLGRNIGEVLGTFGSVELQDLTKLGNTTARAQTLIELEKLVSTLKAPVWPEAIFGSLDQERVRRGRVLYLTSQYDQSSCDSCHALPAADGRYPLTPAEENLFGVQFVKTNMIALNQIGTDALSATNFASRKVMTAQLSPYLPAPFTGAAELPAPAMLSIVVGLALVDSLGALNPSLTDSQLAAAIGYRRAAEGYPPYMPPNLLAYRARPLDGIWATAPYLHNGSVKNLYQLLLPTSKRQQQFYVGSREFNPHRVGFFETPKDLIGKNKNRTRNVSLMDTRLPGNANQGHEYGTWMSHQQRLDLIEFMKTL